MRRAVSAFEKATWAQTAQRPHRQRLDESNRRQRDTLKCMGAVEVRIAQLAAEKDVLEKRCVAAASASEEAQQDSHQAHTARPIDAASVEWLDAHVTPLLRSVNLLLDPRVDVVNDRSDGAAGRYKSRLDAGTRTSSTTFSTTSADNAASDQRLEGEAVQLEQDAEQALEVKAALRAAMSANVVIRCVSWPVSVSMVDWNALSPHRGQLEAAVRINDRSLQDRQLFRAMKAQLDAIDRMYALATVRYDSSLDAVVLPSVRGSPGG